EFQILGVLLQGQVLIPDCSCATDIVDGQHDKGKIEVASGVVGNFDGAVNPLAVDLGVLGPQRCEWSLGSEHTILLLLLSAPVDLCDREVRLALVDYLSTQLSVFP